MPRLVDSFQRMDGTFEDWTIQDCMWYFTQLNWEFAVNGDTKRVEAVNSDWLIAESN